METPHTAPNGWVVLLPAVPGADEAVVAWAPTLDAAYDARSDWADHVDVEPDTLSVRAATADDAAAWSW